MSNMAGLMLQLKKIRHEFDDMFTKPWVAPHTDAEHFVFVRIKNDSYAIRLNELSEVITDKKITSLHTANPKFLGVMGLRSEMIPVYDLGKILGYSLSVAGRYYLLSKDHIALNVDAFDGYKLLPRANLMPNDKATQFMSFVLKTDAGVYPLIDVGDLVQHLS